MTYIIFSFSLGRDKDKKKKQKGKIDRDNRCDYRCVGRKVDPSGVAWRGVAWDRKRCEADVGGRVGRRGGGGGVFGRSPLSE